MQCDECGIALYTVGEIVPAGVYVRVDDGSFRKVTLERKGPLPASFDGHIAQYRGMAGSCACERRHTAAKSAPARGKRLASLEPLEPLAALEGSQSKR